jgi:hypothetical protein
MKDGLAAAYPPSKPIDYYSFEPFQVYVIAPAGCTATRLLVCLKYFLFQDNFEALISIQS